MISVRICSFEVRPLEVFIRQHIGRQVRFQVSAQPLGKKAAGLIEKETNEHRTLNVQHRTSNECILSVLNKIPIYIRRKSNALQCFDDEFYNRQAQKGPG